MRRVMMLSALLGFVLVGLGCKHIGGQCDCYHDPANAQLQTGGPGVAYHTLGQPTTGQPVPEKMPMPAEKMPAPMGK